MRKWVLGVGKSKARRLGAVFGTAAALLAGAGGAPPDGVGAAAPANAAPAAAVPAADTAPPAPANARPRLVILGDSIAAGYGLRREESFPARLQERIDREGLGFEVVNAGVSGDTSAGGLRRLSTRSGCRGRCRRTWCLRRGGLGWCGLRRRLSRRSIGRPTLCRRRLSGDRQGHDGSGEEERTEEAFHRR
jgi:hypothetical protein